MTMTAVKYGSVYKKMDTACMKIHLKLENNT